MIDKETRQSHYNELVYQMPLKDKVLFSKMRIKEFIEKLKEQGYQGEITVSYSGGKDSTTLLFLVLETIEEYKIDYFKIVPIYAIEITFPQTLKFIKQTVADLKKRFSFLEEPKFYAPKKPWNDILKNHGYPIFTKVMAVRFNRLINARSKSDTLLMNLGAKSTKMFDIPKQRLFLLDDDLRNFTDLKGNKIHYSFSEKCCNYVKGNVKHDIRPSFIGVMASESTQRKRVWITEGCNIFGTRTLSRPLSIWTEKDVWKYIEENNIPVNPAYFDEKKERVIFNRLGCTACPFGSHIEDLKHEIALRKEKKQISENVDNWNRFEILFHYHNTLYQTQIVATGMQYILMDMGIKIRNNPEYMKLFEIRKKQIDDWYKDFRNNLFKILNTIRSKAKKPWNFTPDEVNKILAKYNERPLEENEFERTMI